MSSNKKYDEKRKLLNITIFKARNQYLPTQGFGMCFSCILIQRTLTEEGENELHTHTEIINSGKNDQKIKLYMNHRTFATLQRIAC